MRFGVLGPVAVWTDEGTPVTIPGAKVRALLAVLLVHRGEPVTADRLIDDLWGDDAPRNAQAALQVKVSQLRKALDDVKRDIIVSGPSGYLVRASPDAVDADQFANLVRAGRPAEALELWRGPAFADFADQAFAGPPIAQLTELRLSALEDHAEARLKAGQHSGLVGELSQLVSENPLHERLSAALMRALYRSGRQAEALECYRALATRLSDELGVDPSPELAALYESILRQDSALTPSPKASNITAPVVDLVGRAAELDEIGRLLDHARLVTLTGPGGVGKTQLSLESARRLDDVCLVELAGFDGDGATPDALADMVSSALGIRDDTTSGRSTERLTEALRRKQILLLLDNCEHLIEPVAALTEVLLKSVPSLKVLATSREPLAIAGEQLFPVSPLALPENLADVSESPAVQLFVARTAAVTPGFVVTRDNAQAIAAICHRLDGLPLALELAATRVRVLGVHDLAVRLEDRFRVLTSGHRTAPARQQTLRAMIDWSWDLLSSTERAVLRRLAVHADGSTLASAEAVCAGDDVEAYDVLDLLARLVDRSLVVTTETPHGVRYRLLETVADYGRQRLAEADEDSAVRQAHAAYYVAFAEQADSHLRGPDQRLWLQRLDAEGGNLRAALATAVRDNSAVLALRLVNALSWYGFLRGKYQEAHRSLTTALAVAADAPADVRADAQAWQIAFAYLKGSDSTPLEHGQAVLDQYQDPAARARARWLFGYVGRSGTPEAATDMVSDALTVFRSLDDQWSLAAGLCTLAELALMRGDLAAAQQNATTAAEIFASTGDRWGQIHAAETLGQLAEFAGDHQTSGQLQHDALQMAQELEIWPLLTQQLARMGRHAMLAGDHAAAQEFLERSLRVATDKSGEASVNMARGGLAMLARRQGRHEAAEELLQPLLRWERQINYDVGVAFGLTELGFNAAQRGDVTAALDLHREGLTTAWATGNPRAVAHALEGLSEARALSGSHTLAAHLLGAATAARESVGAPLPAAERGDVDRITALLRASLGEDALAAELARGRDLDIEGLVSQETRSAT
ncbi:winged helix-turn-helix domain-containing protein [Kibdelosporangium philippinense]|uniref:Winged helix-turn-helix domain-containing protein n=1 Tax=Kibdelosporangium philippinense TaxID=211113 RepID=A0ABS8Z4W9_9PSEU|nr:BTAD domain-containing putative transcriptional regulator [Kibdelosporangium philippinense]MCE7002522.1 winged helix-turn-helix domain-containing protein [Kibdelosporangium philippinense]